jgi:hypothetical protein
MPDGGKVMVWGSGGNLTGGGKQSTVNRILITGQQMTDIWIIYDR